MTPQELRTLAIWPAFTLLPEVMRSAAAERMLVAIALQESDLRYRRQLRGPARGWWQFEVAGVRGVMSHSATREIILSILPGLGYSSRTNMELQEAIEHNDVLAAVFARLNLWWLPRPLATTLDEGWDQYQETWNPGKPHPERWPACWAKGGSMDVRSNPR